MNYKSEIKIKNRKVKQFFIKKLLIYFENKHIFYIFTL